MAISLPESWLDSDLQDIGRLAPIHWLRWSVVESYGVRVGLKREDLLHPYLGGNKLYKLHSHMRAARTAGHSHLVSFGGAWSNHIIALAAAGKALGFRTSGVIRGERPAQLSATLRDAAAMGMQLHFVSRADYRKKADPAFLAELLTMLGPCYLVPEGGGDLLGARGCQSLGQALERLRADHPFDFLCCAVGTGSSLAGLAAGVSKSVKVCGFSVLKGEGSLADDILRLQTQLGSGANWCLETGYHGGGYARRSEQLVRFMQEFEFETGVALDPVYTAKMMWGIARKAEAGEWPAGARILALHSGGLQGRRGFDLPM